MLEISGSSVCRPLQINQKSVLERGLFPQECKKLILSQYKGKVTNSRWKIIVLSPCYLYVAKHFKLYYTILSLVS